MACSAKCMEGDSCSNVNVISNLLTIPFHYVVSLRIFNSKYQFLGIVSNVCMNRCVHSISDFEHHKGLHLFMWLVGSPSPVYFCAPSASSGPKRIFISLLHYAQSFIPFLCVAHHLARVAFRRKSSEKILYCLGTCNSNAFINISISVCPSYLGGSHSSVPIQCKDWFKRAHRLVNTSCIFCCQFSRPSSEYDAHEMILLQLSMPSVVGLT